MNFDIEQIKSPSLTSTSYGSDVSTMVNNINDNFARLSNHDFVKGDRGNSIHIKTIDLANNIDILNRLKSAVLNQNPNSTPKIINGVHVLDFFNNPGNISLIYEEIDGINTIISSLPYTFKDLRFQAMNISNSSEFQNEMDFSCIINFSQNEFVATQLLPTIYYDNAVGAFCWIINGIKTGLEAQGPRGFEGKAGTFKNVIAMRDSSYSNNTYKLSKILYNGEWVDILNPGPEFQDIDHASICSAYGIPEETPVMVIIENNEDNLVFLSETYKDADMSTNEAQMLVHCSNLNQIFDVQPLSAGDIDNLCNLVWK